MSQKVNSYKPVLHTYDEIRRRYPRLIRHMMQVAILCEVEAVSAINSYELLGDTASGSEAVAHFGGAVKTINIAWKSRHSNVRHWKMNFIRYVLVNRRRNVQTL